MYIYHYFVFYLSNTVLTKIKYFLSAINTNIFNFNKLYIFRQQVDGTYILEVYKDDKKGDTKATIVMDLCDKVIRVIIFNNLIINI